MLQRRKNRAGTAPVALIQMLQGLQISGIVCAGVELDVFGTIAGGATTTEAVAARIGTPLRSTRVLLDALTVIGLLSKQGTSYGLTQLSEDFLVPGTPTYAGDLTRLLGSKVFWNGYRDFADAVRNDGCTTAEHAETPENPFWEVFARSTSAIAMPAASALAGVLERWLEGRGEVKVLDVAAGSGIYGLTLARRPGTHVTLLDWPNVLEQSRTWVKKLEVPEDRIAYLEGDMFQIDYGGPYDVVILSHVYHHFDDEKCARLSKKVAQATAPGGRVIINDFVYDDDLNDKMGVLFSATMLVWTRDGLAHPAKEYKRWLTEAGLRVIETHPFAGLPSTFFVAEKA